MTFVNEAIAMKVENKNSTEYTFYKKNKQNMQTFKPSGVRVTNI